jgi:hypothetical protein
VTIEVLLDPRHIRDERRNDGDPRDDPLQQVLAVLGHRDGNQIVRSVIRGRKR